jgi:hypothetical protein
MEGKTKEDFKDPIYSVQLHGIEEHVLSIYPKIDEEAEEYPAVSSMNDYPFLLSKWQSENLMKPGELLMETDESSEKEGGRR